MKYLLLVMYFFSAVSFASHCSGGDDRDQHSEETSEAKVAAQWIKQAKKQKMKVNAAQWLKQAKKSN